jgi:hypothetical protein
VIVTPRVDIPAGVAQPRTTHGTVIELEEDVPSYRIRIGATTLSEVSCGIFQLSGGQTR